MKHDSFNQIKTDGLRYKNKETGSIFIGAGSPGQIKSCLLCGKHMSHKNGTYRNILAKPTFVCFDCSPAKPA